MHRNRYQLIHMYNEWIYLLHMSHIMLVCVPEQTLGFHWLVTTQTSHSTCKKLHCSVKFNREGMID
jgi:hypothetical protein